MWGGFPGLLALRASSSLRQPPQARRPKDCETLDRSPGDALMRSIAGPLWSECTESTRGRRVRHEGWWHVTMASLALSGVELPCRCGYTAPAGSVCNWSRLRPSRSTAVNPDPHNSRFSRSNNESSTSSCPPSCTGLSGEVHRLTPETRAREATVLGTATPANRSQQCWPCYLARRFLC